MPTVLNFFICRGTGMIEPGIAGRAVCKLWHSGLIALLAWMAGTASLTAQISLNEATASEDNVNLSDTISKPEPSNHATEFNVFLTTHRTLILKWTDAMGDETPDGYLVRGSTNGFDAIPTPVDGQNVANRTDWVNGLYANKVGAGIQADTLTGVAPGGTYYFKLFAYANSATRIDYKTGGNVPSLTATTEAAPFEDMEGSEQLGYTTNTLTLGSGNWLFNNALLGKLLSDKRHDQQAVRIQDHGFLQMAFDISHVESISLEHANFGTDTGGRIVLEISTDTGTTWQQIGSEIICGATLQTASFKVHLQNPMRFRLLKTGGTRINLDNLRLTPFQPPPTLFSFQ